MKTQEGQRIALHITKWERTNPSSRPRPNLLLLCYLRTNFAAAVKCALCIMQSGLPARLVPRSALQRSRLGLTSDRVRDSFILCSLSLVSIHTLRSLHLHFHLHAHVDGALNGQGEDKVRATATGTRSTRIRMAVPRWGRGRGRAGMFPDWDIQPRPFKGTFWRGLHTSYGVRVYCVRHSIIKGGCKMDGCLNG